jgi:negative regulator of sigma E activity
MMDKINNNKIDELDAVISTHVRSVQYKIPDSVEERVNAAILKEKKPLMWFRVSVSAAAAALVLLAVVFIFQPFLSNTNTGEPVSAIMEIKTEFELTDKNIKILWVQKKDFELKLRRK